MKVNNILLTKEKATLFITLYAKALDYRSKKSLIHDKMADDIINSIDFDFSQYNFPNLIQVPIRARQFDDWTNDFIKKEQKGVIVSLGCGIDTRVYRINPPDSFIWFDIDYPDVIELRKNLLPSKPSYHMIASSIMEKEWLEQIPNGQPTLIIVEGVLMYLDVDEVKMLFERLTEHFQHGRIIFDVMNPFMVASGRKGLKNATGAVQKWNVNKIEEVDALNDKLEREMCIPVFQAPCVKELPINVRLFSLSLLLRPKLNNMLRLLSYKF